MSEQLAVQVTTVEGYRIVEVAGEIDISTGPALRTAIEAEVASGARELIVDLGRVRFMDSSGLSLLIRVARQLGPQSFGVVGSQIHVDRIFTLTGSDKLIPRFDSMAEAIDFMRGGDPRTGH
jgi:anti-sigma B factor antagonist